MTNLQTKGNYKIRDSHFPVSIFFYFLGAFFLMSGTHMGILVLLRAVEWNIAVETVIPILYWFIVAIVMTFFTRRQIKKVYEIPMKQMAEAAGAVAHGDFSVYLSPIHTNENMDYLDVMIMDFNKMVEELGSIETLKTDFFSNVSHEIKTPIAVIQNAAEILNSQEMSREEQEACVATILHASKRLSALISNILKLNKLEKQNIQPVMDEYDLCEQLCCCALQFEQVWEEKGIEFDADIEERRLIWADESLLEIVWTNLLSNAMKFTEAGGSVKVSQYTEEEEVIVKIADTGCGMSKETMQHIFDKFYQGDTSHSTAGNGLGLALVYRIVQMMDGYIEVESEAGKGSCFIVHLPLQNSNEWRVEDDRTGTS